MAKGGGAERLKLYHINLKFANSCMDTLIKVENLKHFDNDGVITSVARVSFEIHQANLSRYEISGSDR